MIWKTPEYNAWELDERFYTLTFIAKDILATELETRKKQKLDFNLD